MAPYYPFPRLAELRALGAMVRTWREGAHLAQVTRTWRMKNYFAKPFGSVDRLAKALKNLSSDLAQRVP